MHDVLWRIWKKIGRNTKVDNIENVSATVGEPTDELGVGHFQRHLQSLYGHVAIELPGQCLNISFNLIDDVAPLLKRYFPSRTAAEPTISIGNFRVASEADPRLDIGLARNFADHPLADRFATNDFHAWITFDEMIVDFTLLYSLAGECGLTKDVVLVSPNNITTAYGPRLEFIPYRHYSKRALLRLAGL